MMMTAIAPVLLDDTTIIDTEIADMMAEISAIIYSGATTFILPIYPQQMMVYEKDRAFTPTEIVSHTGISLTPHTVDTITDTVLLRKKITALMA
jgi:hypothetical protein